MLNLVVIVYDDLDQANQVMGTIGQLVKEYSLMVEDAVIVEHKADGKMKLYQLLMVGLGAVSGVLWGGLIGMIFFMFLFGMVIGVVFGVVVGAVSDYGVDDQFVKDFGEKLFVGGAVVFVLVAEAMCDKVVLEIVKYGGYVIQSLFSNEQQDALQQVLDAQGAIVQVRWLRRWWICFLVKLLVSLLWLVVRRFVLLLALFLWGAGQNVAYGQLLYVV